MKNLTKMLVIAALVTMSVDLRAQKLLINAGLNLSKMDVNYMDVLSLNNKIKAGFHFGLGTEITLGKSFILEPILQYTTRGTRSKTKETFVDETYESTSSIYVSYLNLPLVLKGYLNLGKGRIFGLLGLYAGYGLNGYVKMTETYNGMTNTDKEKIRWGAGDVYDLKRFDTGLRFGEGISFKSFEFSITYDWGLRDISDQSDMSIKNKCFSFSLSYILGKNRIK